MQTCRNTKGQNGPVIIPLVKVGENVWVRSREYGANERAV